MTARAWLVLAVLVVLGGTLVLAVQRLEGTPPRVDAPESIVLGTTPQQVAITLEDSGSGLREFGARLLTASGSTSLIDETYPGSLLGGGVPGGAQRSIVLDLDVASLKVPDGAATLVLSARDWSWRRGFGGNESELSIPLTIDTRPPSVSLISGLTYVYRGGSAAAVYRLKESVAQDGIRVAGTLYPGHPHPTGESGVRVALFSIPVDAPPKPTVELVAIDAAGNEGKLRFPAHVLERRFSETEISIGRDFLERVALPLAQAAGHLESDPVTAFQWVNSDLRAQNEASIREQLSTSAATPHWGGAFEQMPGSKVMSRFAEVRSYRLDGRKISEARHFGFDLASTARAMVGAAADGVVVSAGPLGIYGQCVLIDHGLGLGSLYGHLSQVDVAPGDRVRKGQRLGLSGETGLAGGDHLHFAVLVSGSYVDPLEWWDPRWVRSHIEVRLERSTR